MRAQSSIPRLRRTGGFTLVEMLVAVALFLALMAAVSIVFALSVRLSEETFQKQEAYDIARGAMAVLERDLNRIHTSRGTGASSTFYGSPFGMTFVMKIQAENSDNFDLARVTYVFHKSAGRKILEATVDDDNPEADRRRPTYALIRYIEPGVEDIDSFPVDWTIPANPDANTGQSGSLQAIVNLRINGVVNDLRAAYEGFECGPYCEEQLDRAIKRELWIRMLSGGDGSAPDAWNTPGIGPFVDLALFPEDYILAENIVPFQFATDANGQPILTPQTDPFLPPQIGSDDQADVSNELSLLGLVPRPDAFFTYRELGTRVKGNSYNLDGTVADPARPIITTPGPGFLQEDTSADALREYAGIDLAYWNDYRNVEYQVRKTAQNVLDPLDTTAAATLEPDNYVRTGSPLDPRLPESINVRFTLFLQAPSVGSPDFLQTFSQRIPVPTGFRRPNEIQ